MRTHEDVGDYQWDAENRLIKVESQLGTVHYGYDAQGRRQRRDHGTQTTHYIYDGWNVIAELGGNLGVQRSHLWGTDMSGSEQVEEPAAGKSLQGIGNAVECYFKDPGETPQIIRLHFARDEVLLR